MRFPLSWFLFYKNMPRASSWIKSCKPCSWRKIIHRLQWPSRLQNHSTILVWTNKFFFRPFSHCTGFKSFHPLLYGLSAATILTASPDLFGSVSPLCRQHLESHTPTSNSLFSIQGGLHYFLVILIEIASNILERGSSAFPLFSLILAEISPEFHLLSWAQAVLPNRWSVGCMVWCTWISSIDQIAHELNFGLLYMW